MASPEVRILAGGTRQVRSTFHFDDVLTSFSTQEDVFRATLQPLVGQVGSRMGGWVGGWGWG